MDASTLCAELDAIKAEVGPLLDWLCKNGDWGMPSCDCEYCQAARPRLEMARTWAKRLRGEG